MTWKIERKNLNFRTHIKRLNRKTICYSRDEQIHDNVIGMYIEQYYFRSCLKSVEMLIIAEKKDETYTNHKLSPL
jgi:hypothetical protein